MVFLQVGCAKHVQYCFLIAIYAIVTTLDVPRARLGMVLLHQEHAKVARCCTQVATYAPVTTAAAPNAQLSSVSINHLIVLLALLSTRIVFCVLLTIAVAQDVSLAFISLFWERQVIIVIYFQLLNLVSLAHGYPIVFHVRMGQFVSHVPLATGFTY